MLATRSSSDSDSDSAPRVHPAAPRAALPSLHGFSCAFAERRCGHDELFHEHYTRTNLRKGDKILRCFPHCCPDHVTRSFCGASLHLDVRWNPPSASSPVTSPDVLVFARFRVRDTRGLSAGDHVTMHEISQSLQSESNPHGEWISARAVSTTADSQQHLAWVFEVNHEARWYYHWESGVAKRHRLKHHVLDVFVLSPSFSSAGPWLGGQSEEDSRRPLQVVAATHSPPFRLISFRRATAKAVQALSVPREPADARPVRRLDAKSKRPAQASKPTTSPPRDGPSSSTAATLAAMKRGRATMESQSNLDVQRHQNVPSPPSRLSFANLTASLGPPQLPSAGLHRRPLVSLGDHIPLTALRLQKLFGCLRLVRTTDALQYMDTFQRVYAEALSRSTGLSDTTLPGVSPVDAVHQLLADTGLLHRGRQAAPLPHELTAILCELLLWLAFDVDLHHAVASTFAQEAASVFMQPQLQSTYASFLEWLVRHVDVFLRDRNWRLEDVVQAAAEWLSWRADASPSSPPEAFASGLRTLVAQLSEQVVRQAKSTRKKRRVVVLPRALGASSWAINGGWHCAMLQGGLRATAASVSLHSPVDDSESLLALFLLLRELGTVSVQLGEEQMPTLRVASLLHPGGYTELRLNQASQWFTAFPSGISTAALPLGGLCWGDHVGNVSPATREIHVNLYAWSSSFSSSPSSSPSAIGRCFQLRLATPTPHALAVSVTVTTAILDEQAAARRGLSSRDAVLKELPFWSLQQKLQAVRAFEPSLAVELQYSRVG